jgi:hypothetical protein
VATGGSLDRQKFDYRPKFFIIASTTGKSKFQLLDYIKSVKGLLKFLHYCCPSSSLFIFSNPHRLRLSFDLFSYILLLLICTMAAKTINGRSKDQQINLKMAHWIGSRTLIAYLLKSKTS